MSKSHWLKPAGATYAPTALVSIVCQTHEEAIPGALRRSRIVLDHVCIFASKWRRGVWSEPIYLRFSDRDEFWNWLEEWATDRRRTYIVSPCVSNTLTLLRFWDVISARGAVLQRGRDGGHFFPSPASTDVPSTSPTPGDGESPGSSVDQLDGQYYFSGLIMTGKTDIAKYSRKGKGYCWTSCRQYFDASEDDLANAINFKWSSVIYSDEAGTASAHNAKDRSYLWLLVFQNLSTWWRSVDGGPWGQTIGQLSYSYFRRSVGIRSLLLHNDKTASDVEESALFGGRASLWFRGAIGTPEHWTSLYGESPPIPNYPSIAGPISHVDVRSMYPSILCHELFPVRFVRHLRTVSLGSLGELLQEYGVIATVRLNCTSAEYPFRRADRIVYPLGEFETTLTAPELQYAYQRGEILSVRNANLYLLGRPFLECASRLLEYRKQAVSECNYAFELFIKHLSNSLAGKLAQRKYDWVRRAGMVAEREWGQWLTVDRHEGVSKVYRAIAGMVWERTLREGIRRNMGSVFSYLTAYGRCMMRVVRGVCGADTVLSQDTDGLWILAPGDAPALLERIGKALEPYSIRMNKSGRNACFLSPNHHWIDGVWTLAGYQIVTVASDELRVQEGRTDNPITHGPDHPPDSLYHNRIIRGIKCLDFDGTVNTSGWTVPLEMRGNRPG